MNGAKRLCLRGWLAACLLAVASGCADPPPDAGAKRSAEDADALRARVATTQVDR